MKALTLTNISFGYSAERVFQDFSLDISEGEFLALIGPNGSGKTTLLKIMDGILRPKTGEIRIFGKEISSLLPKERGKLIGYMPQESHFTFNFLVKEIVLMGRYPYHKGFERERKEDWAIAEWAMKLTNTFHLKERGINNISTGERQRVVLARVLTQRPRILLLDEVTSHLDIGQTIEILRILKRLNRKEKITTILAVHDVNLAGLVGERVLLLSSGKIIACDRPENVLLPNLLEEVYKIRPVVKTHPELRIPWVFLNLE